MSTKEGDDQERGPIETFPWPATIKARVVQPGPDPRLHGYSIREDIAVHYNVSDAIYLAVSGCLPTPEASRGFEAVFCCLSACSVAEAPVHAAVLASLCGAGPAGVLQTGAIGLAEQAAFEVRALASVLAWLEDPSSVFPEAHRASDESERRAVAQLNALLRERGLDTPGLDRDPGWGAALACALFACGLRNTQQWMTVMVVARLPLLAAEAFAVKPGDFREYPMDLPHYHYEGSDDER